MHMLIIATALACAGLTSAFNIRAAAQGTTLIQLSWVDSFDRIQPSPRSGVLLSKNLTLVLSDGNRVTENYSASSNRFSKEWSHDMSLGEGWRVESANTLMRQDTFPNSVRIYRVVISGSSCSLTITNQLTGPPSYFIRPMLSQPGKAGHYSRWDELNPRCSIK